MDAGFRWCPHCGKPHSLADRHCSETGKALETVLHKSVPPARTRSQRTSPLIGQVLDGKYRIERVIGSGGVGVVFAAEHLTLRRPVAIKVVARTESDESTLRLRREAELIASIHHPNICNVYDVGRLPTGGPYVVLEHLVGETLADRMASAQRPTIKAIVDIVAQALAGLHAAHSARIIHRDLKPQNIFLSDRAGQLPVVKILDFGFAQDLLASSRITRPGLACGTLQYMSPEQLRVQSIDPRSDLFAMGVILYEALSGRHPFAGPSRFEIQKNILTVEARPLSQRRRDVPLALEDVVTRAMAKDPRHRPSTAAELRTLLLDATRDSIDDAFDSEDAPCSMTPLWLSMSATSSG